jgi:hypothetical protein
MMVLAAAMASRREDNTRTLTAGRGHNDPLTDGSTSKMVWRRRGKVKTCGTGRLKARDNNVVRMLRHARPVWAVADDPS